MRYIANTKAGRVYTFSVFDEYKWLRSMGFIAEYEPRIKTPKTKKDD